MNRKTNKTAQVLRLLTKTESDSIENPLMNDEFKEEVIHIRNNRTTKPAEKAETPIKAETGINVVSELVQEWLPQTLKRFNCCDCDLCKAEMMVEAMNKIPPKYVFVRSEKDFEKLAKIKEQYKQQVINALVRITIRSKNHPVHEGHKQIS
ncbi:MAG: late competence development ComFB family protein [Oscillospiraceae bacterium]